jgi:hypothetical protein
VREGKRGSAREGRRVSLRIAEEAQEGSSISSPGSAEALLVGEGVLGDMRPTTPLVFIKKPLIKSHAGPWKRVRELAWQELCISLNSTTMTININDMVASDRIY